MIFDIHCFLKESAPIKMLFDFNNPSDDHVVKIIFMTLGLSDIQKLTHVNCYQNKEYYKSFDFINDSRLDRMRNDYIDEEISYFY